MADFGIKQASKMMPKLWKKIFLFFFNFNFNFLKAISLYRKTVNFFQKLITYLLVCIVLFILFLK
jgi:hypothetical protein